MGETIVDVQAVAMEEQDSIYDGPSSLIEECNVAENISSTISDEPREPSIKQDEETMPTFMLTTDRA